MKRETYANALQCTYVLLLTLCLTPVLTDPQRYETRREIAEGRHEVNQERREASRQIRRSTW